MSMTVDTERATATDTMQSMDRSPIKEGDMMDKGQRQKDTLVAIIADAAEQGTRRALKTQQKRQLRKEAKPNHYQAMEDLLHAYPVRVRMMEHPEEFEFFRVDRSKDISIAPPPGSGVIDKIESAEMFVESRKRAYEHEIFRLHETEYAMAPFRNRPEFNVIRLFYLNEDAQGNYRGADAKHLTWDEIAAEMESIGIQRSITVLRRWRSSLVREMTIMMFGADGALDIESHDRKEDKRGSQEAGIDGKVLPVQQEGADVSEPEGNS